ncbi:hypothetical protein scyTo_0012342 [Scyliorhinus torazame]|uniref:Uncharacterized protein n=1 Tax=Scyliorhinus torazame TaxID=75743 RepID=A0A401P735_SCYTO|nr:hypothetical protein [Scyliorhinus torazame]
MGILENPNMQFSGRGAIRKNRFKGSDGSTSSDTTSNSYVRQVITPYEGVCKLTENKNTKTWQKTSVKNNENIILSMF